MSYYALFQGWLLLSQPPGCLRAPTTFATEHPFRALSRRSGLFPSWRTKVSPRRLTRARPLTEAFVVWLGVVTASGPEPIQCPTSSAARNRLLTHGCTYMHFGENQLSPGSIGISPLATGHPPVLQHRWVRASTRSHPRFTLPMASSPGFGPPASDTPIPAPCSDSLSLRLHGSSRRLTWGPLPGPAADTNSPDHSSKGTPSPGWAGTEAPPSTTTWASTACGCGGSGSLSSPSRGAFHPSLTVLVHYRWRGVLQPWRVVPPASHRITRVPWYSGSLPRRPPSAAAYGTLTLCGAAFQRLRPGPGPSPLLVAPAGNVLQPRPGRTRNGLGCGPPRSPLLRASRT